MKLINTIYKLFFCIFISEVNNIKVKVSKLTFFYKKINFFRFIIYCFDKKTNPFKSKKFSEFIILNSKKWVETNCKEFENKEKILIENFINHQSYTVSNILIGKYLQIIDKSECIGLLRSGDLKGRILFQSFGINKFYIYNFGGFFIRLKYIYRAIKALKNINSIKKYCDFKINEIYPYKCSGHGWVNLRYRVYL